jgi:hypothetical protein
MADARAELRARVGAVLVWVGVIVLALSLPATFGWGLRVEFAGLRLSVFNPGRPQALGFLIGALGLWLLGAAAARVRFARPLAPAGRIAGRGA